MRIFALLLLSSLCLHAAPGGPFDPVMLGNSSSLNQGLVGYWKLDEASGTRWDYSYKGDNLTANNAPGSDPGKVGNCATFATASLQSLSCSSSSTLQLTSGSFTIAGWFFLNSYPAAGKSFVMVGKDASGSGNRDYVLQCSHDSVAQKAVFTVFRATDTAEQVSTAAAPSTNTWHFLAAWHDASAKSISLLIDSSPVVNITYAGTLQAPSSSAFGIGARAFTGSEGYMNGMIDEVGLWNRVLSARELSEFRLGCTRATFHP